jgi:hypothetical protein
MTIMTLTRQYSIHGVEGRVTTGDADILEAIDRRLRRFRTVSAERSPFHVEYRVVPDVDHHVSDTPSEVTRPVLTMRADGLPLDVRYDPVDGQLHITCDDAVRAVVNARHGSATVFVAKRHATRVWLLSHPILTLAMIELLRTHNLYSLHAAALSVRGAGLLLAGASGAGKSTLALALARAGLGFLGDDTVFLAPDNGQIRARAFPDELDISPRTAAFFPELRRLVETPPPPGRHKHGVFIEDLYPVEFVDECVPRVVVIPQISTSAASVLTEVAADDVFVDLVANVLLTHPRTAQAHLDAIAVLLSQARCYRLSTGRDLDAISDRLRDLLTREASLLPAS